MQELETNFFSKSNNALCVVVKNTSCSHGWLRLVMQIIFGAIIVGSFIMIVRMAMQRPPPASSRCAVHNCLIVCSGVHLHNLDEEEDIVTTAMETELQCTNIILTLRNPIFINGTIPMYWMSRMPTTISVLNIIGGNLRHISASAFVGQFAGHLKSVWLEDVTISQWASTTFVGLSSLRHLTIKNCIFGSVEQNVLKVVESTIQTISVTHSRRWNPGAITGNKYSTNKLDTVDFSFNDFENVIKRNTFEGLKYCKTLYLNSCKITTLGVGAFDPLESIEILFLSDNYLFTVPAGLFQPFLKRNYTKPIVHLQNNRWRCDCFQKDLIQLSEKGLLPVDTICKGPPEMVGKSVDMLKKLCNSNMAQSQVQVDIVILQETKPVFNQDPPIALEQPCFYGNDLSFSSVLHVVSPVAHFQCSNISFAKDFRENSRTLPFMDVVDSDWIRPTLILRQKQYSMIQVSSKVKDHGLIWYQSSCPNEVYCLNVVPHFLRIYNSYPDTEYTFCPFNLQRIEIPINNCVVYNFSSITDAEKKVYYEYLRRPPFLYIIISLVCLVTGAIFVYTIIRKNPILLKGSKRLLFVKHRNVDALVLPPKIPLRSSNSLLNSNVCLMDDRVFTLPDDGKLSVNHFIRSNSVRSDRSSTPTYVSAMQPTEAQLAEWRIRHHFDKSPSIISISSDISTISWTSDFTSAEISTNVVYESLK